MPDETPDLGKMLADAGLPAKKGSDGSFDLVLKTGVIDLSVHVRPLQEHLLLVTRGYLAIPPDREGQIQRALGELQWLAGLARFLPVPDRQGDLAAIEVGCILPMTLVDVTSLGVAVEAIVRAAIWYAPPLAALATGGNPEVRWPEGDDPALTLDWAAPDP